MIPVTVTETIVQIQPMPATKKFTLFTRAETISLIIIFVVLAAVSIPNFAASLRRARDQVRRDDLGGMQKYLALYYAEFGQFPLSSPDGKVMDCIAPGDKPFKDKKGNWVVNTIPCIWGKDRFINLITGKVYSPTSLPNDPDWNKGVAYFYMSDGDRYQIFASMEISSEAEVDPKIISQKISCGSRICNVGRSFGCNIPKTLKECEEEASSLKK